MVTESERTGNIRPENLSNVLLSGETGGTAATGMSLSEARAECCEWAAGPGRETIEWILSDVRRPGAGAGRILCSDPSAQGGEEVEEVSDPSVPPPPSHNHFYRHQTLGTLAGVRDEYNNNIGVGKHWLSDTSRGYSSPRWHRTMLMLKLTKTWELYWSGGWIMQDHHWKSFILYAE